MSEWKAKSSRSASELSQRIWTELRESEEWVHGRQLPTERALASRFNVARNTIRRALSRLEAQGAIERRIGAGTFVTDQHGDRMSLTDDALEATSPASVLELRSLLEPAAMELVVVRATGKDIAYFEKCVDKCESAANWREFDEWDMALHAALMRAARNDLLDQVFRLIQKTRESVEWSTLERKGLTPQRRRTCEAEHRRLLNSIRTRDVEAARHAAHVHLQGVKASLLGY